MVEIKDYFYKYHKRGDHTASFGVIKQEAGTTSYYQYVNTEGYWYMMKSVRASTLTTYTYTVPVPVGTTALATGWIARGDLTYTTYDGAFA